MQLRRQNFPIRTFSSKKCDLWWSWRRGILFGLWLSGGSSRKNVCSQDRNLLLEGENGISFHWKKIKRSIKIEDYIKLKNSDGNAFTYFFGPIVFSDYVFANNYLLEKMHLYKIITFSHKNSLSFFLVSLHKQVF